MKTLYNIVHQYESILNPDQNKVMSRMTDEMIRSRILEYCTKNPKKKDNQNELWVAASPFYKITKVDKDDRGWYVDTKCPLNITVMRERAVKSYYEHCISKGQKMDKQKGFLIEDIGIYFRWRKHSEGLSVDHTPNFEYTDGLPEELDELWLYSACEKSKKLDVRNKIKTIVLSNVGDIKISGNGCNNVIIYPDQPDSDIIVPNGVKIYHPETKEEFKNLIHKFRS